MRELLAVLPDKQREILILRVVVGLSAGDTAEAVGSTAVAAAVVGVAAFGAVLGQVKPGDALYGVRITLFGEAASVHDDEVAVSAEADLDQVEQMIALGQWDRAHEKLAPVGANVQTVKDSGRKQGLMEKVNRLNAKVITRNVIPPGAPVITVSRNPFGG